MGSALGERCRIKNWPRGRGGWRRKTSSELHGALTAAGYRVIGPRVSGNAIVLGDLTSARELPFGWGVTLAPGGYRLRQRVDNAAFGHSAGPGSWKEFLHPPRELQWSATRADDGTGFRAETEPRQQPDKLAFFGVRPCDLRAIQIQDQVLGYPAHPDSGYARRRAGAFIVAANCTEPGETCFCASMDTGPRAGGGYDLLLTELVGEAGHEFVVEAGSAAGRDLLADLTLRPAESGIVRHAQEAVAAASAQMGRNMEAGGLRELLAANHDAARWDDVASRCLTCGNCTMACPTCFCTSVEDVSDLSAQSRPASVHAGASSRSHRVTTAGEKLMTGPPPQRSASARSARESTRCGAGGWRRCRTEHVAGPSGY